MKTRQNENAIDFQLSAKDEKGATKDFYYAFVKINGFTKEPDFWIIPSKIVCPLIQKAHKKWEKTRGINNKQHSLTCSMRKLPVELRGRQGAFYPAEWEKKLKKYCKNLSQLK